MLEVPRLKMADRQCRYVSGQARIAQILEAAMDVLIEHGYSAITLREIARRCGIRVGAVSYYYDSREALIRDLVEAIIGPYVDEFDAIRQARERPAADSEVIAPTIPRNSRPGFRADPAHRSD